MSVVIKGDSNVNLDFSTGGRITGDFSNATLANRVYAQNTTANAGTSFGVLPNGTGANSAYNAFASSDPTNTSFAQLRAGADTADVRLTSGISGTGTYLPMTFYTGGSERVRIDTSGNVGVGATPSAWISSGKAIDIAGFGSVAQTSSGSLASTFNAYQNSAGNWIYKTTNAAAQYQCGLAGLGQHAWFVAPSGTAGNTITFTQAMTLTSGGDLLVGQSSTGAPIRFAAKGASTSSGDYTAFFTNSAGTTLGFIRNDGAFNTGVASLSPYNLTTASAANLFVDSGGTLYRSTSSLKYKTDVQDAVHGLAEIMALRPVTYKGKSNGDTVFGGLIAEEVHAVGLTEFVQYAPDGSPDALAYGNMVSLCIKAIQEQQAIIELLTARITALEAK